MKPLLAMDRDFDTFGRLHVERSHMSKAMICDYAGAEIPKWRELGLDPLRVYRILRDPKELAKAADTFNNLPVLDRHIPHHADAPIQEYVVGTTGSDSAYDAPYLDNSMSVWTAEAIALINSGEQEELSACYGYDADMTPGKYEGLPFDGIMRNIVGNHVALVKKGRAGPDVLVGDSALNLESLSMLTSRRALVASGAIAASLVGKLAADAKVDYAAVFGKDAKYDPVTTHARLKPYLAADAEVGLEEIKELLEAVAEVADGEASEEIASDDETGEGSQMAFLKGKLSDEDYAAYLVLCNGVETALDEDDEDNKKDDDVKDKFDKGAMDAAITKARTDGANEAVKRVNAITKAREEVKPYIGEIDTLAMDSAADVYALALKAHKVDTKGVDPSAFGAMVRMLPKPGDEPAPARGKLAMDSADERTEYTKKYAPSRLKIA